MIAGAAITSIALWAEIEIALVLIEIQDTNVRAIRV